MKCKPVGVVLAASALLCAVSTLHSAEQSPSPPNPWPDSFSRRGFQLGISLQDFKSTPFPDQGQYPGAFSVCSNEAKSKEPSYVRAELFVDAFQKAGMIKCVFFYFVRPGSRSPYDIGPALADDYPTTEFYFITDDITSTPRLFWVHTEGPSAMVPALVPIFKKAYGEPSHAVETWQSQGGAKFDNDVYVWSTPSSIISLKHLGQQTTTYDLEHKLLPLDEKFRRLMDQQEAEAAKKL